LSLSLTVRQRNRGSISRCSRALFVMKSSLHGKRISELRADCYIDGSVGGNETQYMNHSCEPNADVFIIDKFMIVFALREIRAGEEITVDYLNSFAEDSTVCQCRTPSCPQRIDLMAA
jgi:hypothetical protein